MLNAILCELCTRFYLDMYVELVRKIPIDKRWGGIPFEEHCKVMKCRSFPDGIPEDILLSEFMHFEKHPLQKNDIVFEFKNIDFPEAIERLENFKEQYAKQKKNGKQ